MAVVRTPCRGAPSHAAKNASVEISTIVPLVSHADHSEHSVQVIITDQGIADLRGKSPHERSKLIVDNCAHPDFRDALYRYLELAKSGQTPQ